MAKHVTKHSPTPGEPSFLLLWDDAEAEDERVHILIGMEVPGEGDELPERIYSSAEDLEAWIETRLRRKQQLTRRTAAINEKGVLVLKSQLAPEVEAEIDFDIAKIRAHPKSFDAERIRAAYQKAQPATFADIEAKQAAKAKKG